MNVKIIENIKKFLGITAIYKIRYFRNLLKTKSPVFCECFAKTDKRILLIDAPFYENLGDHAICLGIKKFMYDNFSEYRQYEIQSDEFHIYYGWLKKNIDKNDIICLNGGGNLGTRYRVFEAIRRIIIKNFSNNKIIIFPQTFDYDLSNYGQNERKKAIKIYNKATDLTILAREIKSYNIMVKDYEKCKVFCYPDIALYLKYPNSNKPRSSVRYCLRNDSEKTTPDDLKMKIKEDFPNSQNISTSSYSVPIRENDRFKLVSKALENFSTSEIVITDKLHAMIFCYITNTPCYALPNATGKSKNVYDKWLINCNFIKFYDEYNYNEVIKLKNVTIDKTETQKMLTNQFDDFAKKIKL